MSDTRPARDEPSRSSGNALTQREIDAILQRNTPAPLVPAAGDVAPYNFYRPPRVSKDRRASLESIYARFALSVQALLSSMLRQPMDVVLSSVEQAMFSEFILSLASPCASFTFRLGDSLGGTGAVDLSTEFAYFLVDRMFGGHGEGEHPQRAITSLEQAVVRSVTTRFLDLLHDAWSEHLAFEPELIGFESNPDMLQIAGRADNVLVTSLEVRAVNFNGFVTLCLPMASLESFLQDKGASSRSGRPSADAAGVAQQRAAVASGLSHAGVALSAKFPIVRLPARALAELEPGQVLHLGHGVDAPVDLHLNGRLRFRGALGQIRRRVGLRIVEDVPVPAAERLVFVRQGRVE